MKILRKKDIVSVNTLRHSAQYDIDTAWQAYHSHERIHIFLYGSALLVAFIGVGCFVAALVSSNPIPFVLGFVAYVVCRTLFTLSNNYHKQGLQFDALSTFYDLQQWYVNQDLEQQELIEEFGDTYFDDDYFDKPSWLYSKPAETKSQFEIDT